MINILSKQHPQRSDFAALLLFTGLGFFCQISASLSITQIAGPLSAADTAQTAYNQTLAKDFTV